MSMNNKSLLLKRIALRALKKPNGVASGSVVDSKDDGCMYPGGIATEVVVEQF